MVENKITVEVFRFDPSVNDEPYYETYETPLEQGASAMDLLDYIYQNLDGTLAYFDHAACSLGICARCAGRVNGKPGLLCQTIVEGNIVIEPISESRVIKDLVVERGEKSDGR